MSAAELYYTSDLVHPIDIVEALAEQHDWAFDRLDDDQIVMVVQGQWRSYSLSLALTDKMLRLVCTFEMDPADARMPALYETISRANDMVWSGSFSYWDSQRLMAWRYGLILSDAMLPELEQLQQMITAAMTACERFYPAFQLVAWADHAPSDALALALADAVGHA